MEVRLIKGVINLLTGFIMGMMVMAVFYCNALNITSGAMYIDGVTVTIVIVSLLVLHLVIYFDPSFKDDGWKEHAEHHYARRVVKKPSDFVADKEAKEEELAVLQSWYAPSDSKRK
jgi:UDP-N-acetylmuramyl pentapeptide phosphotransferase/UDP-N-acetylglucosamine-1-phosphate transferase